MAVRLAVSADAAGAAPVYQYEIATGILLAMFSLIPNEANLPPREWRRFER